MSHDVFDRNVFNALEKTTPEFSCTLTAADGVTMIPGSTLTSLQLTLYADNDDLTIINGRDHQDVLNNNGVTVYDTLQTGADGHTYNLLWQLSADDMAVLDDALPFERHIALFEWAWPTNRAGKYEFVLVVGNLQKVS